MPMRRGCDPVSHSYKQAGQERAQPVDPVEVPVLGHHRRSKGTGRIHAGSRHSTLQTPSHARHQDPSQAPTHLKFLSPTRPRSHTSPNVPLSWGSGGFQEDTSEEASAPGSESLDSSLGTQSPSPHPVPEEGPEGAPAP